MRLYILIACLVLLIRKEFFKFIWSSDKIYSPINLSFYVIWMIYLYISTNALERWMQQIMKTVTINVDLLCFMWPVCKLTGLNRDPHRKSCETLLKTLFKLGFRLQSCVISDQYPNSREAVSNKWGMLRFLAPVSLQSLTTKWSHWPDLGNKQVVILFISGIPTV